MGGSSSGPLSPSTPSRTTNSVRRLSRSPRGTISPGRKIGRPPRLGLACHETARLVTARLPREAADPKGLGGDAGPDDPDLSPGLVGRPRARGDPGSLTTAGARPGRQYLRALALAFQQPLGEGIAQQTLLEGGPRGDEPSCTCRKNMSETTQIV